MPHAEQAAAPNWRRGLFTPAHRWGSEVDWDDPESLRTWAGTAGNVVSRIDRELTGENRNTRYLGERPGGNNLMQSPSLIHNLRRPRFTLCRFRLLPPQQ